MKFIMDEAYNGNTRILAGKKLWNFNFMDL